MPTNWKEVRARSGLDKQQVAEEKDLMLAEVRAHRLAEVRTRHDLSQQQVADLMGITQARVSAIERGELSTTELSTLQRYIAALGGKLKLVADFGDESLVVG